MCPLLVPLAAAALLTSAAPSAKDLAKQEFTKAKRAYDLGQFNEALGGYQEAYRLDPKPAFLFNIAQCQRQLGAFDQAAFFLKRYLSYYPTGKAPNDKTAHELLAEAEQKAAEAEKKKQADAEAQRQKDVELARLAAAAANKPADTTVMVVPAAPPANGTTQPGELSPFPSSASASNENGGTGQPAHSESITGKWWFWTGVGVLAVGAGTGAYLALRPTAPNPSLGAGDLR